MGKKTLREFLDELEARDFADDLDRAAGWIVVSVDREFGALGFVGPFVNVADALDYSGKWSAELNVDSSESDGWDVTVRAIFAPEPLHERGTA